MWYSSGFGLPSIKALESVKREDLDRKPLYPFPVPNLSSAPTHPANVVPPSPPQSRRTSGDDEKSQQRDAPRQSLPSIHELAFEASSTPKPYFPPPATSPVDQRSRTFTSDQHARQNFGNSFSHPRSPFLGTTAPTVPPPPPPPPLHHQPQTDPLPRPSFPEPRSSFSEHRPSFSTPPHNPKLPTLHPLQTQSPPPPPPNPAQSNHTYPSYQPQGPSAHGSPAPHSAGPTNQGYPYSQYPSNYPLSAPAPGPTNSGYPSPATFSAPPRTYPNPSTWPESRVEEKKLNRSSLAPYGESVKRHLESFDLEASLNEMSDGSARISTFSNMYRQRAHETQRIGMSPHSMPRLEEVDDMLRNSEKIVMSLQRMREVVFNHQQASLVEAPQDPRQRPTNGYDYETQSNYSEESKGAGGFAGPDGKKRRGRAAPPGRCHSCNRAETPEWRRGPDGARTLCNACGLHYAKLTRKMGGKQAMTSSNLRPKSLDQGSPTA
ncbi:unnamed protein product [Periconia digitata]|uniref:GATA-type domain-containing protein n=1 Tax=Periconia digitata TaxID=1303443 RepID=A0A9W4U9W9_9PLEO|nr:unnamed protein product [Periconia digitata]